MSGCTTGLLTNRHLCASYRRVGSGMSQPSLIKTPAASSAVSGFLTAEGPNCRISLIQTTSLSQRWMSQFKSICADWSFGSGRGFRASSVAGGGLNRSNRLTISVVLPGRGQFLRWVGPDRRVKYQNVGWIALQPLGFCIRAEVNSDDDAVLLGCGSRWSVVGERIERLDAVHTASGVRRWIVHYF